MYDVHDNTWRLPVGNIQYREWLKLLTITDHLLSGYIRVSTPYKICENIGNTLYLANAGKTKKFTPCTLDDTIGTHSLITESISRSIAYQLITWQWWVYLFLSIFPTFLYLKRLAEVNAFCHRARMRAIIIIALWWCSHRDGWANKLIPVVGEGRLFKGSINIKEGTISNVHICIWHIIK